MRDRRTRPGATARVRRRVEPAAGAYSASGTERPAGGLTVTPRGLLLLLVVLGLLAMSLYPVRQELAQRQRVQQLGAKRTALSAEVASLRFERQRLDDPAYIEALAKKNLQMVRPGEQAWVLVGQPPVDARHTPSPAERPPWYQRLWQAVRDLTAALPAAGGVKVR